MTWRIPYDKKFQRIVCAQEVHVLNQHSEQKSKIPFNALKFIRKIGMMKPNLVFPRST
jgi:hypothetical protein